MGLADRTHTFWQVLRAESPPGARLRRRVAATAAMVVFMLALLATVGFLRIALIAVAVVALVTGAAAILLVIGRYRAPLVGLGSVVVRRAASLGSSVAAAVARRTSRLVRSGSQAAVVARQRADACLTELRDGYVRAQA